MTMAKKKGGKTRPKAHQRGTRKAATAKRGRRAPASGAKKRSAQRRPAERRGARQRAPRTVASAERCFWVHNGPVVNSIAGLREALTHMSDEQFAYHTTRDGNDFARWIRDVLENQECADAVARARTRAGTKRALASCGA